MASSNNNVFFSFPFFETTMMGKDLRFYARVKKHKDLCATCFASLSYPPWACLFIFTIALLQGPPPQPWHTRSTPLHENINNWSPPVDSLTLCVDTLALEEVFSSVVRYGIGAVLQDRCSDWGLLGARPTSPVQLEKLIRAAVPSALIDFQVGRRTETDGTERRPRYHLRRNRSRKADENAAHRKPHL